MSFTGRGRAAKEEDELRSWDFEGGGLEGDDG